MRENEELAFPKGWLESKKVENHCCRCRPVSHLHLALVQVFKVILCRAHTFPCSVAGDPNLEI